MNKVIAFYKNDKSVIIVYPVYKLRKKNENENKFIERILARTIEANKNLQNLEYDIIDSKDLPSRDSRAGWECEKGKLISINETKLKKANDKINIKKLIEEEKETLAIKSLKNNGKIPQDYQ